MTDQKLRKLLEKLHDELEHTRTMDEKGRELLRDLSADIQNLLDHPVNPEEEPEDSMLERFQDTIDHFEVTHPNLTMAISELMTILSNAGI